MSYKTNALLTPPLKGTVRFRSFLTHSDGIDHNLCLKQSWPDRKVRSPMTLHQQRNVVVVDVDAVNFFTIVDGEVGLPVLGVVPDVYESG